MKLLKARNNPNAGKNLTASYKWVVLALAAAMILLGATSIIKMCLDAFYYEDDLTANGYPIMLVAGFILLKVMKDQANMVVLVSGIIIASVGIIELLITEEEISITLLVLAIGFDLLLIISSMSYYAGNRHNAWRLMVLTAVSVSIYFLNIFASWIMEEVSLFDSLASHIEDVEAMIVCVIFIVYLSLPGVKEDSVRIKMRTGADAMQAVSVSSPYVYITGQSLRSMIGEDRTAWTTFEDGPISAEGRSEIWDGKVKYECTSRIWSDEDVIRVSMDRMAKTSTYGYGFDICSVAYTEEELGKFVHLFGRDGKFVKLKVVEDAEKERNRLRSILRLRSSE